MTAQVPMAGSVFWFCAVEAKKTITEDMMTFMTIFMFHAPTAPHGPGPEAYGGREEKSMTDDPPLTYLTHPWSHDTVTHQS